MQGLIYYDGSAHRCAASDMSHATFAVVQVDGLGNRVSTLHATVPACMPQTSQAAEHCGRTAAIQMLRGASILTGDCKVVVHLAYSSDIVATRSTRMHAGARRLVYAVRRMLDDGSRCQNQSVGAGGGQLA